jgi:hypothetical protein
MDDEEKIKNAIRIIDERLVLYYQWKKSEPNHKQVEIIDNQIEPLQKIRDELRPKEKTSTAEEDRAKVKKIQELIDANIGCLASNIILTNIETIIESKDYLKLEKIIEVIDYYDPRQESGIDQKAPEHCIKEIKKILKK